MKDISPQSHWVDSEQNKIRVLAVVDLDNHIWVYFKNENTDSEESCYLETFLNRFKEQSK